MAVDPQFRPPTQEEIEERKNRRNMEAALEWEARGSHRCKTCKAPVIFAKNRETGKWQILDALPDWVKGNVFLSGQATHELNCRVILADEAASNRAAGVGYYTDHHATCPNADQHRRSR